MRFASTVCLLGLALAPLESAAEVVGRVLIAVGEVSAMRAGREVALATGATVEPGDVIRTAEASSAQVRFADESLVALREKSEFQVGEYRFTGSDDGISQAAFNLVRGGLRTLTGVIGRVRHGRYAMRTPLATVGIRGTTYSLVHCAQDCRADDGSLAPDGTYGVVFDGRVAVANPVGERVFGADEAFYVADISTPPQALLSRPGFLRDRLEARARREEQREQMQARAAALQAMREQAARLAGAVEAKLGLSDARPVAQLGTSASPIVVVTDLNDPSGNVALLGAGLGAGVSFSTSLGPAAIVDGGRGTVIELDRDRGVLEQFVFNGGLQSGRRNGAFVSEGGSLSGDGGAVFGRWGPGATVSIGGLSGVPSTGVHFFYGNLTPESLVANAPSGATAVRYDYAGGPRPTDEAGHTGQFLNGNFVVDFVRRSIAGSLQYQVDQVAYSLPVPQTPLVTGRGFIGFGVDQRNAGTWSCACSNTSGTLDRYTVSGLFLGSRAQGLGVNFATEDAQAGRTAGAALFRCVSGGCR